MEDLCLECLLSQFVFSAGGGWGDLSVAFGDNYGLAAMLVIFLSSRGELILTF